MKLLSTAAVVLALCAQGAGAVSLYAISGDDVGAPRRLNYIDTDASTVTPLFDLGDGSLGYFGLAFTGGHFYTVGNDRFGASTLHRFTLAGGGATDALFGLGAGFTGGLAAPSSNQLYALASGFGPASLFSLDLNASTTTLVDAALGFGVPGGLTWDASAAALLALGSDTTFAKKLYSIDPAVPGSSSALTATLGFGINGGLDLASAGELFAIGNDNGRSQLLAIAGGAATPLLDLAPVQSFTFSALTSGPVTVPQSSTPVPEGSTAALLLTGLWLVLWRSRPRARRRAPAG